MVVPWALDEMKTADLKDKRLNKRSSEAFTPVATFLRPYRGGKSVPAIFHGLPPGPPGLDPWQHSRAPSGREYRPAQTATHPRNPFVSAEARQAGRDLPY